MLHIKNILSCIICIGQYFYNKQKNAGDGMFILDQGIQFRIYSI